MYAASSKLAYLLLRVLCQGQSHTLFVTRRAFVIQTESAALIMCWYDCSDVVYALKGGLGEVLQSLPLQGRLYRV